MEKFYCFAGVELAVSAPETLMYTDDRMLAPFRVECVSDPHRFRFALVEELTPPTGTLSATVDNLAVYETPEGQVRYVGSIAGDWHTAHMRALHMGKEHIVELKAGMYENGMTAKTALNAMEAEHLVAENGGFVFHSSCIRVGDRAVLFTAPSGTGKSTQADLWNRLRGAEILNGDRTAVRVTREGVFACGIPFKGSSQFCENRTLPLAAVVYLAQAPQTAIHRLKGLEAFRRVWEGVSVNTWDKRDMENVMDTVMNVVQQVPVWYLPCTPDESAVAALEQQLGK